jgi:hypothetical protein
MLNESKREDLFRWGNKANSTDFLLFEQSPFSNFYRYQTESLASIPTEKIQTISELNDVQEAMGTKLSFDVQQDFTKIRGSNPNTWFFYQMENNPTLDAIALNGISGDGNMQNTEKAKANFIASKQKVMELKNNYDESLTRFRKMFTGELSEYSDSYTQEMQKENRAKYDSFIQAQEGLLELSKTKITEENSKEIAEKQAAYEKQIKNYNKEMSDFVFDNTESLIKNNKNPEELAYHDYRKKLTESYQKNYGNIQKNVDNLVFVQEYSKYGVNLNVIRESLRDAPTINLHPGGADDPNKKSILALTQTTWNDTSTLGGKTVQIGQKNFQAIANKKDWQYQDPKDSNKTVTWFDTVVGTNEDFEKYVHKNKDNSLVGIRFNLNEKSNKK